jgi:hypothetical protein
MITIPQGTLNRSGPGASPKKGTRLRPWPGPLLRLGPPVKAPVMFSLPALPQRSSGHMIMADLLQRIAERGDAEAFNELFQSFAPRVKSYMMRQGANPTTAEELAQETLLMVWRKAGLYSRDKGSASTWIFTIARNLRIDRLRR